MVQRNKVGDSEDGQRPGKRLLDNLSCQKVEGRNKGSEKIMKRSASTELSDVVDKQSLPSKKNTPQPAGKKPFSSSASQYPDGRKKGSELKRTVNKSSSSSSIKLSDVDNLISLPHMEDTAQLPTSAVVKVRGSPNYMKPTSCSDARKDDSKQQVSIPRDVNTSCEKNQATRNLKKSKPDQSAPGSCLARSSSLRLGRTLTNSPSFKQTGSLKKSTSKAALCSDIHAQRATCSSLLKESKFPPYVKLEPGATESQGTSLTKLCTYKYCSLNGHHHTLVPPLRSFVSARRRSLKNQQRSMKLEDVTRQDPFGEESSTKGKCLAGSNQERVDFFVDIHCNGLTSELTGDGADYYEDDNILIGIQKTLSDLEDNLLTESNCVEAENKTEQNPSDDGWVVVDDYENTLEDQNDESPLLSISGVRGTFDAESDKDLKSIWEVYEFGLQEFKFIDAHLDEQVYMKFGNEAEFDCKSESIVMKNCFEDELEGGCQGENENFEEQIFQDNAEVEEMIKKEETDEGNKNSEGQNCDYLTGPGDMSEELVAAQQTNAHTDISIVLTSAVDSVDTLIAASEENIAAYKAENEKAEDCHSYANSITELADQDLIEHNEDDDDQEENKDDLVENLVRDFPQIFSEPDQMDAESEITSDGERVLQDFLSADDINEDEENVTEKVVLVHQSYEIHELVSPENADYVAKGTGHSDNCEGKWCADTDAEGHDEDNYRTGPTDTNSTVSEAGNVSFKPESNTNQEFLETCNRLIRAIKCKEAEQDADNTKGFNPLEPNYLPMEPEAKGEKVDLRHQIIDERKNSEEWMVDYALQKTVTKLAPVKRKKVALLVEAFETVAPTTKRDHPARRASFPFANMRTIQACN